MLTVLSVLLVAFGALLLAPIAVLLSECGAALLPVRPRTPKTGRCPTTVVLVPAHDEELVIGPTLERLLADRPAEARILVVADNCSDATVAIAQRLGVEVTERHEPALRGKAYALAHGLSRLAACPPDVVVVVDADCRLSEGAIAGLSRIAGADRRPVQADYRMELGPSPTIRARISAFAFAVRNRVRPIGLLRMGLGCQLMGTGMAVPYDQLVRACAPGPQLVEDLILGLALAEHGHVPLFWPGAQVTSPQPEARGAALAQRRRWEHGAITTALAQGPRLVAKAIARRDLGLAALALDLLVPPLALLCLLVGGHVAASAAFAAVSGRMGPLLGSLALAVGLALAVAAAWAKGGRGTLGVWHLLLVPAYIAWKLPLYLALALRRKQASWERTTRTPSMDGSTRIRSGS